MRRHLITNRQRQHEADQLWRYLTKKRRLTADETAAACIGTAAMVVRDQYLQGKLTDEDRRVVLDELNRILRERVMRPRDDGEMQA